MKKLKIIMLLSAILVLFSFTIVQAQKTYSVEICNVEKKAVIDFIANNAVKNGVTILTINDYQLILKKDDDRFMDKMLYGSRFNRTPEIRISFNFSQNGNNVIVSVESRMVTNPNSAYEKSEVIDTDETQKMLNQFKTNIERTTLPINQKEIDPLTVAGFTVSQNTDNKYLTVKVIKISSNAFNAGLRKGDIIKSINGFSIANMQNFDFSSFLKSQKDDQITLLVVKQDTNEEKILIFDKQLY